MRWSLLLPVVVLFASCTKIEDGDDFAPPVNPCGTVSGILRTDVNGVVIMNTDTTDWQVQDTWCAAVEALFADRPPVVIDTTEPDSLLLRCYPNPTGSMVALFVGRDDTGYVDLRFVDPDFQLVHALDSMTTSQIVVATDSLDTPVGGLVRLYYRVVHADGTAHRGHGDLLIGE